jgi:uracil-DNA glycosylase
MKQLIIKKTGKSWNPFFEAEFQEDYFNSLLDYVSCEREQNTIFPGPNEVFKAFMLTPLSKIKVVIIGQDPYHGHGQANGLAFSVHKNIKMPPSLKNIFKEMTNDLGCSFPKHGELSHWAKQGVLLLNTILTVRKGEPGSHKNHGWERFTNNVIEHVSHKKRKLVFFLWGNHAKQKKELIQNRHLILEAAHPSPFSAYNGFFGCKHFSKANEFLIKNKLKPIQWEL